jgi:hypothetical protein
MISMYLEKMQCRALRVGAARCRDDVDLDPDRDQELQGWREEQKVQGGRPGVEMQSGRDAPVGRRYHGGAGGGAGMEETLEWSKEEEVATIIEATIPGCGMCCCCKATMEICITRFIVRPWFIAEGRAASRTAVAIATVYGYQQLGACVVFLVIGDADRLQGDDCSRRRVAQGFRGHGEPGDARGVGGGSRRAVAPLRYGSQAWVDRAIEDGGGREDQGRRRWIPGAGGPWMVAAEERTVMADSVDRGSRA